MHRIGKQRAFSVAPDQSRALSRQHFPAAHRMPGLQPSQEMTVSG